MMKKTILSMLVLSMSGLAAAGLQLTVNGQAVEETTIQAGGELLIGVINNSPGISEAMLLLPIGPGEWIFSDIQPGGIIPGPIINSWGWEYFEVENIGSGWRWPGGPVLDSLPIGLAGEFGYRCTGLGDTTMAFFSEITGESYGPLTIHQIPEPMTMALMGLGMVLMRRRRGINS